MTQNDEGRRGKTQRVMETRADTQNGAERLIQRRFPFLVGQVTKNTPFFDDFSMLFLRPFSYRFLVTFRTQKPTKMDVKMVPKIIEKSMKKTFRF